MKTKPAVFPITTCLSITDKAIKLVQSKDSDIISLRAFVFSQKSDEEIARGIDLLFKGKTQKELGRFILLIPRQLAALHYVRLPSTKPDEIREMARLQAAKQLPYEPQAIILGYQVIQVTPEGYSDVLLIIVHQDIIKKYLKYLEKNRLEPQEITIDSQGILRWYKLQKAYQLKDSALIVDFDSGYARLDIITCGIAVYSRAFSMSKTNDESKQRLLDEINKSLSAYGKENIGVKPEHIIFTGAEELSDAAKDSMAANLPFTCVKLAQSEGINFKAEGSLQRQDSQKHSFASLLGLVLSRDELPFNLLPEDTFLKRQKSAYKQHLRATGIVSSLIIAVIITSMVLNISARKRIIRQLTARLRALSADVDKVEMMSKKLNYVKTQLGQSSECLDTLIEIFRIAPSDISLVFFGYDTDKPVVLKGQAKTLPGVFNFLNILESSEMFKKAQVRYSSTRKVKDDEIADFEIVCLIEEK